MKPTLETEPASFPSTDARGQARPDRRGLDIGLSLLLIVLAGPLWLLAGMLRLVGQARATRTQRVGRGGVPFWERSLALSGRCAWLGRWLPLRRLPALFNVLRGEMAFVGPRAVSPDDPLLARPDSPWRFAVRPGLVCLWWLRQRANIDYEDEVAADYEYIATRSPRRDMGILLRALWTLPFTPTRRTCPPRVHVLGLRIDNLSMADAVNEIVRRAEARQPTQVCFLNADCVNIACRDAEYRRTLRQSPLVLADGIGLKIAGKLLGRDIRQNVNGTDLFPRLCDALAGSGLRLFLLGARPGVAEAVARWSTKQYPRLRVVGWRDGYFSGEEEPAVLRQIAASGADVLLVAFGAPRQDVWIERNLAATGASVALGVGGLFDYYSGRIPRAPQWMRELCLEWLFRVYQEPGRLWKRYFLGNGLFLARVLGERLWGPPTWAHDPRATSEQASSNQREAKTIEAHAEDH
jgi:N-acetylglucosaminyldiphosphoundecaprenol N-acetyl-beta-D-mannosaminyltransferase